MVCPSIRLAVVSWVTLPAAPALAQDRRRDGTRFGTVAADGTVRTAGAKVGQGETDGDVRKQGTLIGSAQGVKRPHAAGRCFFASFGKP